VKCCEVEFPTSGINVLIFPEVLGGSWQPGAIIREIVLPFPLSRDHPRFINNSSLLIKSEKQVIEKPQIIHNYVYPERQQLKTT
jgi:hypothetical protein